MPGRTYCYALVVAALIAVCAAFGAADRAIAAATLAGRWIARSVVQAWIKALAVAALLSIGAAGVAALVAWRTDTFAGGRIEHSGWIALCADAMIIAARRIFGAD